MSKKKKYRGTVEEDNIDELPDSFWKNAQPGYLYLPKILGKKNAQLLMSGKAGRPKAVKPRVRTSIRLLPEVDAYFRATGKGWQSRINQALKEWAAKHPLA